MCQLMTIDLKMVNFLLGQQSGFTKCPCGIVGTLLSITQITLACVGGIGALQTKERHQQSSGRQRQDSLPTAAHQARLD